MSFSISNTIRGSRVIPDAEQYAATFRLQGDAMVCPLPSQTDTYGRPADLNSLRRLPAGVACQNQVAYIERENSTRPIFSEDRTPYQFSAGIQCGGPCSMGTGNSAILPVPYSPSQGGCAGNTVSRSLGYQGNILSRHYN